MSSEPGYPAAGPTRLAVILMIAFSVVHFVFLEYWLCHELGTFYYYRVDDVSRLELALLWAQNPSFLPDQDWLPLPSYILGSLLKLFPDPWMVPLHWHNFLAAAVLVILGLITLEFFPGLPLLSLVPLAIVPHVPYFERLALSTGAEVELWFFLLLGVWFWLLYLRRGLLRYAWLNAACLFLASMVRYEAWLFILAFLPFQLWRLTRREGVSWRAFALPLFAISYILFFISYQETLMTAAPAFHGLPLSWRGLRLYFRGGSPGAVLSFLAPAINWFSYFPALSVLEVSGAVYALVKRPELRWYPSWIALAALLLVLEAGLIGTSSDGGRLVVIFHLLQVPLICCLLRPLLRQKLPVWPVLAAPAAGLLLLLGGNSLPRLRDSQMLGLPGAADSYIIARAVHEIETEAGISPRILVENQPGPGTIIYDYYAFLFSSFGRLVQDRQKTFNVASEALITENNPSVFSLEKDELELYLRERGIGWIVTCGPAGTGAVKDLASPVGRSGSRALFAYQLPAEIVERTRKRIKEVEGSVR